MRRKTRELKNTFAFIFYFILNVDYDVACTTDAIIHSLSVNIYADASRAPKIGIYQAQKGCTRAIAAINLNLSAFVSRGKLLRICVMFLRYLI